MKFLQRFGRSLMLPVAVLPLAAILSGLGYWIINATGNDANLAGVFLQTAGGALLDNLPLLFAIGVSIGMATKPDGTSALAGLVSWLIVKTLLDPERVALLQGSADSAVDPTFDVIEHVILRMRYGQIGVIDSDRYTDVDK